MDIDRKQRTDIDTVTNDRLTLSIDESNIEDNPYVHETIKGMEGNNWVNEGTEYVKYNLVEDDNLILIYDPITKLSQKSINKVTVSFDYMLSNNINRPILDNISLVADSTYHEIVNYELNNSGHVDIDCEIFGIDEVVLNTIISIQGFGIGLNFNGKYSNATIRISNVKVSFKYSDKLYDESGSVINRLEPYIDFYRDDDGDLILQIGGDATGKGMDRGGTIDTYSKAEIDNKLATKVNVEIGKGLSSNDYTLTEKTKLSTIENNANYYIHPSSHNSSIITESSALNKLETAANATQHEINLAINEKIGSGGSGSGGSYINDYYWDTATQDIILDYDNSVDPSNIVTSWSTPLRDDKVPSEKLVKETIDNSGGGSSVDIVTDWEQTLSDSKVASEKLVKDTIDTKANATHTHTVSQVTDFPNIPSKVSDLTNDSGFITSSSLPTKVSDLNNDSGFITSSSLPTKVSDLTNDSGFITSSSLPTKISDLTNDSNFIETSNTAGLIKNDGTIDTNQYLTQHQSLANYIQKSNTSGLIKNDGTVDTNTYLTQHQSLSGYLKTTDVVDNLTSTSSTAPLSAKQGKALADLIGNAITYINQ